MSNIAKCTFHIFLALVLTCPCAYSIRADETEPGVYDRIWDYGRLYSSDDGLFRTFDLSGRLQAEAVWFDADQGDFDDTLWRRFRFGFKSRLANDWVMQLEGDFDLNKSAGDWYNRLTDAYIGWKPGSHLDLRFLKHSAGFTLDGATSSKELLTLQRSNLTNNLWFTTEYFTGVSAKGTSHNGLKYKAGVFSASGDPEISLSEGGLFVLSSLGYDWGGAFGMDKAEWRLDYVHNQEDAGNATRDFSDVVSLVGKFEKNRWGLWTDLAAGKGYFDQPDIWGLSLMPFYNTTDRTQLVFRYTYLSSDGENGLRLARYQDDVTAGRGDGYNEFYFGFNVFFYGHKLKWQNELQYATMDDASDDGGEYDGWGLSTGLRISW
jgi:phosphate-selective porin OprO/OprP